MPADKKTRERTEGAASAVQAKYGDSCSANRVDPDPTCLDSFGDDSTGPPALPCSRNDAVVGNGAAAPKSCLSPLEMRSPTATGGLLPAGKASTTTRITFYHPRLRFCLTEETNSKKTSTQYASYYSFWRNNQLASPSRWRVIQKKSSQTLVFDPGGSTDHLRTCLFLRAWRALLCGEVFYWEPDDTRGWMEYFLADGSSCRKGTGESFTPHVLQSITVSPQPGWFENAMPSTTV